MRRTSTYAIAWLFLLPSAAGAQPPADAGAQHSDHVQHAPESSTNDGAAAAPAMQGMHAHMQAMREQMARIRAAESPEERERLMREHMQSMQEHMGMMNRQAGATEQGTPRCAREDTQCRMGEMQAQHETMRQRMGEMQRMMEQMMQHLAERRASESADHR